jgi:hypothetical protein
MEIFKSNSKHIFVPLPRNIKLYQLKEKIGEYIEITPVGVLFISNHLSSKLYATP